LPITATLPTLKAMFAVDEFAAAAIRRAFDEGGELAGVVEFQRHFPLIRDHERARECVRIIAGWKPIAAGEPGPLGRPVRRRKGALTPAEAERIQDAARARGVWLMWFVSTWNVEHPGKAVAWGVAADPSGGGRLPGLLVADTLDELRAMLPTGPREASGPQ
jgi:hypothetical protein